MVGLKRNSKTVIQLVSDSVAQSTLFSVIQRWSLQPQGATAGSESGRVVHNQQSENIGRAQNRHTGELELIR
jgi:hypothetical protein